jgi:hypothetical protein
VPALTKELSAIIRQLAGSGHGGGVLATLVSAEGSS